MTDPVAMTQPEGGVAVSALVVYESMFGNTKRVANAIADGLARHLAVETVEVSEAPIAVPETVELVVVGGPTHVHGMTTTRSRLSAEQRSSEPLVSEGIGIREWLERARPSGPTAGAAFDTRINGPTIFTGSAAAGFAGRLRSAGFRVVTPTASFIVDTKRPQADALVDGELERARAWGDRLGTRAGSPTVVA